MLSRRDFLRQSSLLALAPTVPGFLARTARAAAPQRDGRVLVVVQLDGGNDGINTVVPFKDEGYAKHRKVLRLTPDRLVKVNDKLGLHPSLRDLGKVLEAGRLAIVQGVGYPNPNRSHFESMAIWHTARLNPDDRTGLGWLGRALDDGPRVESASMLIGSGSPPVALRGRRSVTSALERTEEFTLDAGADPRRAIGKDEPADDLAAFVRRSTLDAYATADRLTRVSKAAEGGAYPGTGLGERLRLVARLLKVGLGTRVFYVRQGSYDTHSAQLQAHSTLLFELAGALKAFLDDMAASKLADRVTVLCFSEFGRTVKENGSAGTDHGTAGPVFLAGAPVKGGVVGQTPSLLDLDPKHGDLRVGLDFRRIYATILEEWLGLPAKAALAGTFEHLPLFRS